MPPKGYKKPIHLICLFDIDDDGCWLWLKAVNSNGYGVIGRRNAHRVVYEEVVGELDNGLVLDHLCRKRICINPDHMEPVTSGENTRRGDVGSKINRLKTHCPRGHEYDKGNTYVSVKSDGQQGRQCKECKYQWNVRKRLKNAN